MTTPPGDADDTPPQGIPPAYQYEVPPPPHQPPPSPPHYPPPYPGYGYYPQPQPPRRISVVTAIVGPFLYAALNLMVGLIAIIAASQADSGGHNPNLVLGGATAFLALIAFGGGTALLLMKNPNAKGLGLGLMIGWALVSLCSAGFCTGINPGLYAQ